MIYVVFHSTTEALKAEERMLECGLSCELMPVPKSISAGCGLCIKTEEPLERVMEVLKGLKVESVYNEGFERLLP